MEAMNLRKQIENDYLEQDIQERIKHAKLALELKLDQIDPESE